MSWLKDCESRAGARPAEFAAMFQCSTAISLRFAGTLRHPPVRAGISNRIAQVEEANDINNIVNDLFVHRLQDICYSEKQLVKGAAENC
jgi:hypothetical protein